MADYQTIQTSRDAGVLRCALHRPDVRNAFDDTLIAELTAALQAAAGDAAVRVVILQGDGKHFCAGADLNWMKQMVAYTREENVADSRKLADMYEAIAACPKPVVARVQGAALGGGSGLVAACDLAVAAETATFGFPEVKLGILPAVISPYVIDKLGPGVARGYFLTGERLGATEALRVGLVQRVVPEAELDAAVQEVIDLLLTSGPRASAACKRLVREVATAPDRAAARKATIDAIADIRIGAEGQEGMKAFLEKRKAEWAG